MTADSTGLRDRAANVATRIKGWLADSDKLSGPASSRLIGVLEDSEKIIRALLAPAGAEGPFELRYHAAMPGWCKVKGLRIRAIHECEGGGFAITEPEAEKIVAALNAASPAPAQALAPKTITLIESEEADSGRTFKCLFPINGQCSYPRCPCEEAPSPATPPAEAREVAERLPEESTAEMKLAGARSIANSMHYENHGSRAELCWRHMVANFRTGAMPPVPKAGPRNPASAKTAEDRDE